MSDRLSVLESVLEEVFPWYVGDGGQSKYSINKYVSDHGTAIAVVFCGKRIRYLLQVTRNNGVDFTSYFPSVDFRCDGMPVIADEAQRNVRLKDISPDSIAEVKCMADDERLYLDVERGVVKWVNTVYSEVNKGMSVDVAMRVVNRDIGELP